MRPEGNLHGPRRDRHPALARARRAALQRVPAPAAPAARRAFERPRLRPDLGRRAARRSTTATSRRSTSRSACSPRSAPTGFAFSDTAFRIFILMASRRLNSDRFFTIDYTPEVYTPRGSSGSTTTRWRRCCVRHFPQLGDALRSVRTRSRRGREPARPWRLGQASTTARAPGQPRTPRRPLRSAGPRPPLRTRCSGRAVRDQPRRPDERLALAEERLLPDEEALAAGDRRGDVGLPATHWPPGHVERAGNTKTYGSCAESSSVDDDVPGRLADRRLRRPRTFNAWVRFAGPGPGTPPDIEDNGILSLAIKLVGVEGPKLLDDVRHPGLHLHQLAHLHDAERAREPGAAAGARPRHAALVLPGPARPAPGDLLMQGLYARTQTSPLETRYWSCVPSLLGEGRAVQLLGLAVGGAARAVRGSAPPRLPARGARATLASEPVELTRRPGAGRPPPHADRERQRRLAERLSPFVRWRACISPCSASTPRAARLRPQPLLQPVALPARAPAAGKPEPRSPSDLPGALAVRQS